MGTYHPVLEFLAGQVHATSKEVRPLKPAQLELVRAEFKKVASVHERHKILQDMTKFGFGIEDMPGGGKVTGAQIIKMCEEMAPALVRELNEGDLKRTEDRVESMGDKFAKFAPKEDEQGTQLESDAPTMSVQELLRTLKR